MRRPSNPSFYVGLHGAGERVVPLSRLTTTWVVMMEATPALTALRTHSVSQATQLMLNFREREVAVGVGIAVTREMLSARRDAVILKP